MNKPIINISKRSVAYAASAALLVFAATFTVSALMAQPPGYARTSSKGCKDWPLEKDRKKVEAAFDKVLKDSATDSTLRRELLEVSNCYEKPKAAVQRTLDAMPGDKITIPKEAVIIFYEDDSASITKASRPFVDYPSDHCLHIFFLPPVGSQATAGTNFQENLMCCYKPWNPTRPRP
jgi:hypothetical protein